MGSKNRIAKYILPIMLKEMEDKGYTTWVEPFVGGGNMIDKVPSVFRRFGCDLNPHAICALIAIRDHVNILPSTVSEDEYKAIKGTPANPVDSWIRFVCSVGGGFGNGFARDKTCRNYANEGKSNAIKQSPKLQGVTLLQGSYKDFHFESSLIYCDPPYQGTTGYKTGEFNHEEFFEWCREMKSKGNSVFVSEYNAPEDFECVWQGEIKTNFASQRSEATHKAVEKLFRV